VESVDTAPAVPDLNQDDVTEDYTKFADACEFLSAKADKLKEADSARLLNLLVRATKKESGQKEARAEFVDSLTELLPNWRDKTPQSVKQDAGSPPSPLLKETKKEKESSETSGSVGTAKPPANDETQGNTNMNYIAMAAMAATAMVLRPELWKRALAWRG